MTNLTPDFSFLSKGGESGAFIRSVDWQQTPVGPPSSWPQSLRTALSIMLDTHFPMYIAWGKEFTQFYNDGFRPILGSTKHPAFGKSSKETFAEIWDVIGPMFEGVLKGQAVSFNDFLVSLDRHGYLEECYFLFSYSPIRDESGDVGGVLATVTETTERVLGERRMKTLRELSEQAAEAKSIQDAYNASLHTMSENNNDIPFSLCYVLEEDSKLARLVGQTGLTDHTALQLATIDLTRDDATWPLLKVAQTGKPELIDISHNFIDLPGGAWPEHPKSAYIVPISRPDRDQPFSIMVLGISPRKAFDEHYQDFFSLLADHIATAIANSTALEAEKKRAEALAEIDQAKTIFFNNISHEFRTPLTLMLSPLEELMQSKKAHSTSVQELETLSMLNRNARRLLKLVNNLLDFSRIEAGRMQATFEPTDLTELTADLASSFRSTIEHAGMTFQVDCQPLPEKAYLDRDMWEKIVLNLLSNAFKYTLEGKISVRLRDNGNNAELTVADTGIGISEKDLPHIFERFYRVQNTGGRTYEGTGIGLSLVKELVKFHGGNIAAESEKGKGTTITVTVPLGKSHLPAEHVHESAGEPFKRRDSTMQFDELTDWNANDPTTTGTLKGDRKYVLIADDNADMRQFLRRILEQQYEVKTAANGKEAWEEIQRRQPHLLVTDIMMPEMDGTTLLERIRDNDLTRSIPVIFLSARAGEEEVVQGMKLGADDYLVKPFSSRELLSRVEANLKIAESREMAFNNVQNIFMQAPVAICMLRGQDFIVELANGKALEIWGRTAEQAIGKPMFQVSPELIEQGFPQILHSVYTTGERFVNNDTPIQLIHNGHLSNMHINLVFEPYRDIQGIIAGIIIIGVEVTDQVEARKKVETSESNFRNLIAQAPVAICIYRGASLIIELANEECLQMWGKQSKDVIGKPLFDIYPETPEQVEMYNRVLLGGERLVFNETLIEWHDNPKGNFGWYNFVLEPLRDQNGQINGVMGLGIDVTEHVQSRKKVEESEQRLRLALENANMGTWDFNIADGIFTFSSRTSEFFGFLPDEKTTMDQVLNAMDISDRPKVEEALQQAMRPGSDGKYEIEHTIINRLNKRRRLIRAKGQVFFDEKGEAQSMVGMALDITEQRKVRQLLEQEVKQRTQDLLKANKLLHQTNQAFTYAEQVGKFGSYAYSYETLKLSYSDNLYRLLGCKPGEFEPGPALDNYVHPDDIDKVHIWRKEALNDKRIPKWEFRIIRKDGKEIWVRSIGRIQTDGMGQQWLIGTLQDITEEKNREMELKEQSQTLQQLNFRLQQTNQTFHYAEEVGKFGSYAYNYDMDTMIYSDNMYGLLGYEPGAFEPGDAYYDHIHPDDKDYIQSKARMEAFEQKQTGPWEYRMICKNGDVIWARSTGRIMTNEDGSEWLIGTVQDITEEKNRQQKIREANRVLEEKNKELHQQKNFVQTMIDSSVDYISLYDKETRIIYLNQRIEELYGFEREKILGKKFLEVFHNEADHHAHILQALEGQTVHVPIVTSSQTGHIFEDFFIPLFDAGEVYAVLSISHDNTKFIEARERLREVEDKNKELEQFAFLASHDLQEPLNTIASFSEVIQAEEKLSPDGTEYLNIIKESSSRLKGVINDLLAYSRIGQQGEKQRIDLNKQVDEVLLDMQATISSKNAQVEVGDLPVLKVFPSEIRLLFQNLISNALKFQQPNKTPEVKITAKKLGNEWQFVVSDNGIGIEEKFQERIFLVFQRLHTFQEYEGTGIGLAHCQKIINLHGGKLWLESELGKGSHFYFTLPESK